MLVVLVRYVWVIGGGRVNKYNKVLGVLVKCFEVKGL